MGPDLAAELIAAPEEGRIAYVLALHNGGGLPAVDVRMEAPLPDGLVLADSGRDVWRAALTDLGVDGDARIEFVARVDGRIAGQVVTVVVTVTYRAPGGMEDFVTTARSEVPTSSRGALLSYVGVAAALLCLLLAVGCGARSRSEAVRIDQLFLLHDSGMLIRHYTNGNGPQRDSDITGGMLIVLQEFVRDSLPELRGTLEEVRFGDRRVLMARGRHSVIAAIVTGKRLNGLPGRLGVAVAGFEAANGAGLVRWDGDLGTLDAADRAFRDLLVPRYLSRRPA